MSVTTQGVDARAYLRGFAGAMVDMAVKDIRAIPEDKWLATYVGCSKSASDAAVDAISVLGWTAGALKGNTSISDEGGFAAQLKAECSTKDGAIAQLQSAGQAFAS